jgi:glycosyltransferase involved in cell wall biosynthesis
MEGDLTKIRVAIVADWLTDRGGAERVVLELAKIFPQANIFTSVYKAENFPELAHRKVVTTYLQSWPLKFKHQLFAWARPQAMESLDLDGYDIVISSSFAEAKGIITKPSTLHVCYCHTPTRYYWSHYHQYLADNQFGALDWLVKLFAPPMIHNLRIWDRAAADRPDVMCSNSKYIAERIAKYYERQADTIYPPVDTARFTDRPVENGDFYLILGRQIPYKRTDLAISVFNQIDRPLKIIGNGSEIPRLKSMVKSSKIEFLGRLTDSQVTEYLSKCKALIFPQEEDFGIVPLEAMACGKPVIAYAKGGGTETVVDGVTGILFDEQTPESLATAIQKFETMSFEASACRARAGEFSTEHFRQRILEVTQQSWEQFSAGDLEWK